MQQTTPPAPAPQAAKPKPPVPPAEFQEGAIATMDAAGILAILKDAKSTEFQKSKACVRAGELGAKEAVPALAALLDDEHLSVYARYGLEPISDPSAADALRASLAKLKGVRLAGVINSLNKRRDAKSLPVLSKLMYGADVEVARAAIAAIGSIGDAAAVKILQAALPKTTGMMQMTVADASLVCAERLIGDGKRAEGMALYSALTASSVPKPVRLAAMSGIVREETATTRPR
jgi:HEAT repeat protein